MGGGEGGSRKGGRGKMRQHPLFSVLVSLKRRVRPAHAILALPKPTSLVRIARLFSYWFCFSYDCFRSPTYSFLGLLIFLYQFRIGQVNHDACDNFPRDARKFENDSLGQICGIVF